MLNEKFWAKVKKTSGCWFWIAGKTKEGYGNVNIDGRSQLAHRASFEGHGGALLPQQKLLHSCGKKSCVRPDHLYVETEAERFWSKVNKNGPLLPEFDSPCWLWTAGVDGKGYGAFRDAGGVQQLAHKVSWRLSGKKEAEECLLHACDTPRCVNPAHLLPGTQRHNMQDKVMKNRQARGENHGSARLTQDEVDEIRRRYADGQTQYDLGNWFQVSQMTISNIVRHKTWSEN